MFSTNESLHDNKEIIKKNIGNSVEGTKALLPQTGLKDDGDKSGDMNIDAILEREKQHNKTESWNKLDKTIKMQKLHCYAEKYGKENSLPVKDIKLLKAFFKDCLEKNKLQKTKEVQYNKESRDITGIPSLHFNHASHNYTLKITDATRVSTLKSLTPLRSNEPV